MHTTCVCNYIYIYCIYMCVCVCVCVLGCLHITKHTFQATQKVAHVGCLCVLSLSPILRPLFWAVLNFESPVRRLRRHILFNAEHSSKWLFWPSTNASSRTPFILTACFQQLPTLSNNTNQKEQEGGQSVPLAHDPVLLRFFSGSLHTLLFLEKPSEFNFVSLHANL